MKPVIQKQKTVDFLSWLILISILSLSTFIAINLHSLKNDLTKSTNSKINVIDLHQFDELNRQLIQQWEANDYIVYLYQPNSIKKTHKELASTSIQKHLPIRLDFDNSIQLDKNNVITGLSKDLFFHEQLDLSKDQYYVIVPILSYNTVNAEIYIFFNEEQSTEKLTQYLSESQVLSKMLN